MKEDLTRSPEDYPGLRERFDFFCRNTLKNATYDLVRQEHRKLVFHDLESLMTNEPSYCPDDKEDMKIAEYVVGYQTFSVTDERLMEILNRLTKRKRDVLILTAAFGYTNREVAEMLGITKETVKSTKTKAFRDIRNMLAEDLLNERV